MKIAINLLLNGLFMVIQGIGHIVLTIVKLPLTILKSFLKGGPN
jgi:hypothetical protein